jgi:protein-tyrosine-phosphatase
VHRKRKIAGREILVLSSFASRYPELAKEVQAMAIPVFVCHANCCRSVLASYLYEHLCSGASALGAGVDAGDLINDRAERMLSGWGIDARKHQPRQLDRALCDQADGLFVMTPGILRCLLETWGRDLASKSFLFSDPFSLPRSFQHQEYVVRDPSFDEMEVAALHREFHWFRERVVQIHDALHGCGKRSLVAAECYLPLLEQAPI